MKVRLCLHVYILKTFVVQLEKQVITVHCSKVLLLDILKNHFNCTKVSFKCINIFLKRLPRHYICMTDKTFSNQRLKSWHEFCQLSCQYEYIYQLRLLFEIIY